METTSTYSIKYVARRTGLKPHLIRSWEARYQAICPQRSSNRRRCFTDKDIKRLYLLKRAVDQGHTISAISRLSDDELSQLLVQHTVGMGVDRASADFKKPTPPVPILPEEAVATALEHIVALDTASLENFLNGIAVDMPRHAFVQSVVLPLFEIIGDMWRAGKLKVVSEHMASMVMRSILWDMLRSVSLSEQAPRIAVATPVGHWHEIGALAVALAASESGWRACYFGPNLPSEEIAFVALRLKTSAVALSVCHRLVDNRVAAEMKKLRRLVGRRLPIFIGGPGARAAQQAAREVDMVAIPDLNAFRKELDRLAERLRQ